MPFDTEQRQQFLEKYVEQLQQLNRSTSISAKWSQWEQYDEQIRKTPGLSDLSRNPFGLNIIAEVLPSMDTAAATTANQTKPLRRCDIYTHGLSISGMTG